jgi:hypothetical protein
MCGSSAARTAGTATPRPRWGVLYGVVVLGLIALAVADVEAPDLARPTLDAGLAGVTLAAVALWVRGNRMALDLQDWCDCAADTVTVRVISSEPDDQVDRRNELDLAGLVVVWPRVRRPVDAQLGPDDHAPMGPVGDAERDVEEVSR